jgi:hypothetical protein
MTRITTLKAKWKNNETQFSNNLVLKYEFEKKIKKNKIELLEGEVEKKLN